MIDLILDLPVVMLNTLCQWRDGEFSDRIEGTRNNKMSMHNELLI